MMNNIPVKTIFFIYAIMFHSVLIGQKGYDYPVKPGTPEWESLNNYNEQVEACQLPDEILRNINTVELLEICLNYPLLIDILAHNTLDGGWYTLNSNFNGIKMLISRKNFDKILLIKYKEYIENETIQEKSEIQFVLHTFLMEILIVKGGIIPGLDIKAKKELVASINQKKKKLKNLGINSYPWNFYTDYACINIILSDSIFLSKQNFNHEKIKGFSENPGIIDKETYDNINSFSKKYPTY